MPCEFCGIHEAAFQCEECPNSLMCTRCDEVKHRNEIWAEHVRMPVQPGQAQPRHAPAPEPVYDEPYYEQGYDPNYGHQQQQYQQPPQGGYQAQHPPQPQYYPPRSRTVTPRPVVLDGRQTPMSARSVSATYPAQTVFVNPRSASPAMGGYQAQPVNGQGVVKRIFY
eukprot:NODE_7277_length_778_cov_85.369466_g7036_i0.p2 GENE.NODE_7277_length_778_cov_85.369466_g7036_i0~~NODE_7277_length_778_cov_85.369466_g7036_i0.p2  ORF type:complete len:167 (+),score=22.73 NODE_7277_length_778_cov_85.369466_g7036_i0:73-573(+)